MQRNNPYGNNYSNPGQYDSETSPYAHTSQEPPPPMRPNYERLGGKKHTGIGTAGLVCGILSIILFWTGFIGIALGIVALILGILARKEKDSYGLIAIILGIIAIILIFLVASMIYMIFVNEQWGDPNTTPTITISQDDTLDKTGGFWVNFTVESASPDAKWEYFEIIINETSLGTPSKTTNTQPDIKENNCKFFGENRPILHDDKLYCHLDKKMISGDCRIKIIDKPTNSQILEKTIT